MEQLKHFADNGEKAVAGKNLITRLTGRFYTPVSLADRLANDVAQNFSTARRGSVRIVDPFCGDGRIILAFLKRAAESEPFKKKRFLISIWDTDQEAVKMAEVAILDYAKSKNIKVTMDARSQDTFLCSGGDFEAFDIVLTNPPWESLKPDRREMAGMPPARREAYNKTLRSYDAQLAAMLPHSQPSTKFSGWGTNLSRCGLELSLLLLKQGGLCGIVLPSSIFYDQVSGRLRKWIFQEAPPLRIFHYPAEAKLFAQVDQPCAIGIFQRTREPVSAPVITRMSATGEPLGDHRLSIGSQEFADLAHALPLDLGEDEFRLLRQLDKFPELGTYSRGGSDVLWMGRELDETGYKEFVSAKGSTPFIKGRQIGRYSNIRHFSEFIREGTRVIPESAAHVRIAWRDVSRRSQARRMIATIVPAGCVTGNSLQVAYFRNGDGETLHALLGIMNSLTFEFQLRSKLGTGHVSLGTVRKLRVPSLDSRRMIKSLAALTRRALAQEAEAEAELEIAVAQAFGLNEVELEMILSHFTKLPEAFRKSLLARFTGNEDSTRMQLPPKQPWSK